jgi:hypothetical protein
MSELTVHGHQVSNFFELLGDDENALTFAVGWTLRQSPHLLKLLLREIIFTKYGLALHPREDPVSRKGYWVVKQKTAGGPTSVASALWPLSSPEPYRSPPNLNIT